MLDRRDYPTTDAPREGSDPDGENTSRALSVREQDGSVGLSLPEGTANYAELFTRLQKLIDNATQMIRDLRRENTELSGRVSQLDTYIQMRGDVADNEAELHQAAVRLEELLDFGGGIPAETHPSPTPLHRVVEPTPASPTPEPRHEMPTNGHTPAREMPREMPPAPAAPAAPMAPPVAFVPAPTAATMHIAAPAEAETREASRASLAVPMSRESAPVIPEPPVMPARRRDEDDETRDAMPMPTAPPAAALPVAEPAPMIASPVLAAAPPAPPASLVRRPTLTPAPNGSGERFAGTYALVVYPFTRFSDLGQFQSALQELVGIHDVQVRRFAQGTLEMRLSYDGNSPLPQALRGLPIKVEEVDEEEPYRLRVRLDLNNGS